MKVTRTASPLATLMIAVAAVACATAREEVDVAVETDEIIGGAVTGLRPEVGQLFTATGGCTATLISATYFLTAAHCIGYQAKREGSFIIDGQPAFAIDIIIPFTGALTGGHRLFDVALGRLQNPVPGHIARPATIADHIWNPGELLTSVGYGCNNANQTGAGTKRFVERNQGSFNNLCPGDSGGPLFRGRLTSNGAIVGINSVAPPDGFSHPVQYKKRIPSIMRARDLGLEAGIDRPGSDYASFSTVGSGGLDAWVCAGACEADAACKAFSYDNNRQLCFKKNAIPPIVPVANIFSGLPKAQNAIDRPGSDFFSSGSPTADVCQSSCARDNRCVSFTFFNGTCFLKNAIPAASTSCPGCVSGNRRALEDNVDRPGADFARPVTATARACADLCAKDWRCFAFTWNKITHQCHQKNEIPPPIFNPDGVSAMRDGLEVESMRAASGSSTLLSLSTDLPEECQAACAQSTNCRSWNFFPPDPDLTGGSINNPPRTPARCVLQTGVGGIISQFGTGRVSGLKGMEFF